MEAARKKREKAKVAQCQDCQAFLRIYTGANGKNKATLCPDTRGSVGAHTMCDLMKRDKTRIDQVSEAFPLDNSERRNL